METFVGYVSDIHWVTSIHYKISLFLAVISVLITGGAYFYNPVEKLDSSMIQQIPEGPLSGPARRVFDLKIPLNEAGLEDLMALPGIGPGRAQKILQWRENHGPFQFASDLKKVPGIGTKTLEDLLPYLTLNPSH